MSITLIGIILGVVLLVGIILASYVKAPPSIAFLYRGFQRNREFSSERVDLESHFLSELIKYFLDRCR